MYIYIVVFIFEMEKSGKFFLYYSLWLFCRYFSIHVLADRKNILKKKENEREKEKKRIVSIFLKRFLKLLTPYRSLISK